MSRFHNYFFQSHSFDEIRIALEYEYEQKIEGLLQSRLTSPETPLNEHQQKLLLKLDDFLTFFEFVFHLSNETQVRKEDAYALVGYWINVINENRRGMLRRYIEHYGWRILGDELSKWANLKRVITTQPSSKEFVVVPQEFLVHSQRVTEIISSNFSLLKFNVGCSNDVRNYNLGKLPVGSVYKLKEPEQLVRILRELHRELHNRFVLKNSRVLLDKHGTVDVWHYQQKNE